MQEFSEPFKIHPYRYDYGITYRTDAFKEACNNFNRKMGTNYPIETRHNVFEHGKQDEDSLIIQPIYYLFSIIELQFKELSTDEAKAFADAINNRLEEIMIICFVIIVALTDIEYKYQHTVCNKAFYIFA